MNTIRDLLAIIITVKYQGNQRDLIKVTISNHRISVYFTKLAGHSPRLENPMEIHPLKTHIDEVIPLTDEQFDYVLSHFTEIKRRKHQFIVQEGESVNKEFWVKQGCLKSYITDHQGKEHILQFSMENWWVTDYDAFTNQTKAKIWVDCLEDCDLLYITFENREKLSQEMHEMEKFWARKTKLGYVAMQNRILTLLKNTAQERYELLFSQYPELFQRVPKKLLAAYLGVSRETLSRFHD